MILNPRSRLVRWAYLFSDVWEHETTTLCRFFWRAFVFIPLVWLSIVGGCGVVLVSAGMLLLSYPKAFLLGVLLVASITAILWTSSYLLNLHDRLIVKRVRDSIFAQGLMALKKKFCPIIYFEEGGQDE